MRWLENPYWQFFTGEVVFQTALPCNPSSLTRWRQRLGEAGMEELLAQTIAAARSMKAVDARELSRVIVDTTVQENSVEMTEASLGLPVPVTGTFSGQQWAKAGIHFALAFDNT